MERYTTSDVSLIPCVARNKELLYKTDPASFMFEIPFYLYIKLLDFFKTGTMIINGKDTFPILIHKYYHLSNLVDILSFDNPKKFISEVVELTEVQQKRLFFLGSTLELQPIAQIFFVENFKNVHYLNDACNEEPVLCEFSIQNHKTVMRMNEIVHTLN